ncbi:MAG: MBL fold metallo-hydrolase [Patescibacteria group bacterium]|nr:MBL fold metallo-hydrolase [Patescibacteria group bacterium]
MVITYQGDNYFKLQSGEDVILIDPTNQRSFKGTILVIKTEEPTLVAAEKKDNNIEQSFPFLINHQGEYEIKNIQVKGVSAGYDEKEKEENTIYQINFDEIKILCLGHLKKELDPKLLAGLEEVDIMILPGGGKPYLNEAQAAKIVRQIAPSIIIPSLFKDVKNFLKEFDATKLEPQDKLVIKKKDLKPEALSVVWLKP